MVFVEGDASISTYQDAQGQTRSSLNVVQRESHLSLRAGLLHMNRHADPVI